MPALVAAEETEDTESWPFCVRFVCFPKTQATAVAPTTKDAQSTEITKIFVLCAFSAVNLPTAAAWRNPLQERRAAGDARLGQGDEFTHRHAVLLAAVTLAQRDRFVGHFLVADD